MEHADHAADFREADLTIRKFVEDGVETFEAKIDGEAIQWDKGLSYAKHLQTDRLLSAQIPVSDKPDEMLFIIMHQTRRGSEDGFAVRCFEKGRGYDVADTLARYFIRMGWACTRSPLPEGEGEEFNKENHYVHPLRYVSESRSVTCDA